MATKYAGQNALNKMMQIIKTALASKADKTNATTSAAGLMSVADKTKLDGIAAGATKITVDSELSSSSANPVMNGTIAVALSGKADQADVVGKLDKTGGTISGNLKLAKTSEEGTGNIDVEGNISAMSGTTRLWRVYVTNNVDSDQQFKAPLFVLSDPLSQKSVQAKQDGDGTVKMEYFDGTISKGYARLEIGTPTGDNDATTKAYVDTKVSGLQTADQVQAAISSAVAGVYTPKGSIAFASLPTAAAGNKGWVYNITDAFTTDSNFVEGEGFEYPAGTNVVCAEISAGDYGWDVLAGTIDLTELTATEVQTLWDSI